MSAASSAAIATPALTLKRRLNAPPSKVFEAWTNPQKIIHWFGPAATVSGSVRAEMDVRVGGVFRASFNTVDGEYHEVSGIYRDVVPNERLCFTWAWYTMPERESLVTITLVRDGDGTLLTLHHEQFFDEAASNRHRSGWTGTLDKLEKMFA
jgi:uncharacterized protein YndB with AHSA1/START domain